MKMDRDFLTSPGGQLLLVGALLVLGVVAVRWQQQRKPAPMPAAKPTAPASLPKTFQREGAKFPKAVAATSSPAIPPVAEQKGTSPASKEKPRVLPLTIYATERKAVPTAPPPSAPFGRLIPCETVVALESNRLETPVIGLVTEDVWHDGRRVVPAGAEVHGRAALDRTRERLAVQGSWRVVWRTPDADNGTELAVEGLALDRELDGTTGRWGKHDGSAGLRGQVVRTGDDRELKLFAATFLATATTALQDTRLTAGLLGETALPVATARNAVLAGTGAVLREYAQSMRDAIARDGFYLRVPAGKPFYLYVTQTLDRSQRRRTAAIARAPAAPSNP